MITISGTLSRPQEEVFKTITNNGGQVSSAVTKKVTHLICTEKEFDKQVSYVGHLYDFRIA